MGDFMQKNSTDPLRVCGEGKVFLTRVCCWSILFMKSGATGRRFPTHSYKEVTVCLRDWRLLLVIFNDLNDQSEKRNDKGTKLKQLGPCNHAAHPLFFRIGGKEDYPREGELPTVTGSTGARIS